MDIFNFYKDLFSPLVRRLASKWTVVGMSLLAIVLVLTLLVPNLQINPTQLKSVVTIGWTTSEGAPSTDYTFTGVGDSTPFQLALNALPTSGGKIQVVGSTTGVINFTSTVSRAINNVIIEGPGLGVTFSHDASTPLFSVGSQTGWVFRDISTDAGGITLAADTLLNNVTLGATHYVQKSATGVTGYPVYEGVTAGNITTTDLDAPTGRTATYVIAASNATALEKAQADYLCDGTADEVQINAAAALGLNIQLSQGTFYVDSDIIVDDTFTKVEQISVMKWK